MARRHVLLAYALAYLWAAAIGAMIHLLDRSGWFA